MPTKLNVEIITAAIEGYESQKTHIDAKISELRAMLDGGPSATTATSEPPKRKRRKMSAAGKKAIAEAQRKRWAEVRKTSGPAPTEAPKPKRKLSRAGRAAIIAATKKRWAAVRAAKAQGRKAAPKTRTKAVKRTAKKTAAVAQAAD